MQIRYRFQEGLNQAFSEETWTQQDWVRVLDSVMEEEEMDQSA